MIAAIVAMLMTVADPAPAPATVDPPPAPQPLKTPIQIARDNLDQAQQIYTQSCGDRAYGAYDDLCEQLSTQLRQYRIDLDKLERENTKAPAVRPRL